MTLVVTFRKDLPISCGGCGTKFVPDDGPVLGVDERMRPKIWPVVTCPGCKHTVACSPAHVATMELSA